MKKFIEFITESKSKWSYEKCAEEALKYNSKVDFIKNSYGAYLYAQRNKILGDICSHMIDPRIVWTKDKCEEEALKYKYRCDFDKNSPAYQAAKRNGWLDDVCKHMTPKIKNNYWTKDKCAEEALKYKYRSDFEKNSPTAYVKSGKMGWKDEICSHMETNGNKYKRCIYAIEFSDNYVYVGLTKNHEERFKEHLNDITNNSIVLRHYNETGILPTIKKLTDYIDVDIASKLEQTKLNDYIENGWNVLNISKCGNVGGNNIKYTKERCAEEALGYTSRNDFKKGSYSIYRASSRNKWLDEICSHMNFKYKYKNTNNEKNEKNTFL